MKILCYLVIGYFVVVFLFRLCAMFPVFLYTGKLAKFHTDSSLKESFSTKGRPPVSMNLKSMIKRFLDGLSVYVSHQVGALPSHTLRRILYRIVLHVKMEQNVVIYKGCEMRSPQRIRIGKGTSIGNDCIIAAQKGVTFGENVNLSYGVWIWTAQHNTEDPYFLVEGGKAGGPVVIGNRVWLGPRTTILGNVTIGEGAVIAAGAVVTKDVEPFSIYGGIPARKIGERNRDLLYEFDGKPLLFI